MSALARAASAVTAKHANKSAFFGSSRRGPLKAAPAKAKAKAKAVAARADGAVWQSMSSFMKNKCKEAGRAAWIELDKQVPGARLAYADGSDVDAANGMESFCDGNDNAEECKMFDA